MNLLVIWVWMNSMIPIEISFEKRGTDRFHTVFRVAVYAAQRCLQKG